MKNSGVDRRRLQLLLALSRMGSMRAVADTHHLTTSTVSQEIAALASETGAQLIEPKGRRVRLTAYAVTWRGRATWPPLRAVLDRMRPTSGSLPRAQWPRSESRR